MLLTITSPLAHVIPTLKRAAPRTTPTRSPHASRVCKQLEVSPIEPPLDPARPDRTGSVKGLTVDMLEEAKCHLILGNTYHLGNQPGAATVEKLGGLHNFTGWRRAMLTDSGARP